MMVFSQISDEAYEEAANQIAYCKLFPLIVQDFLTRLDCRAMMSPTNLIAQIDPGQAVTTATPAGAGAGSTVSPGQGRINAIYMGDFQKPATKALERQKKAIKEAGGKATTSIVNTAVGG
jgi:hypothetical protein